MTRKQGFQDLAAPRPVLVLQNRNALFVGPAFNLSPHRIGVHCFAIALEQPFSLALPMAAPALSHTLALIRAGERHHLHATGAMAFIYSVQTVAVPAAADIRRYVVENAILIRDPKVYLADKLVAARQVFGALGIASAPSELPRLSKALHAISQTPDSSIGVAGAAHVAGLATQRFQRMLKRQTGLTFRQHMLRERINKMLRALAGGANLTEAAHHAGFSSSAHLSSTFRAMFGMSPSILLKARTQIIIDANDAAR